MTTTPTSTSSAPGSTSSARPPRLVAEAVGKSYPHGGGAVPALGGVDLTVGDGEFVAVMGASGSGKSTLMHAVAGLTSIDSGRITVEGQDLSALSDSELTRFRRRRIGLVFQDLNLVPVLSAEDNVRLPAMAEGGSGDRAVELLESLGLGGRRDHLPDALSGGERQRVAIARALMMRPALLLADEPTGSLDSVAGQDLCRILRRLTDDENASVVVVTHEPTVAMWADRVVVLHDGTKRAEFALSDGHDADEVVRGYLDALPT